MRDKKASMRWLHSGLGEVGLECSLILSPERGFLESSIDLAIDFFQEGLLIRKEQHEPDDRHQVMALVLDQFHMAEAGRIQLVGLQGFIEGSLSKGVDAQKSRSPLVHGAKSQFDRMGWGEFQVVENDRFGTVRFGLGVRCRSGFGFSLFSRLRLKVRRRRRRRFYSLLLLGWGRQG
jgi:hypothetical protein